MEKAANKYLKTFFAEKEIENLTFEIEHKEQLHLVDSEFIKDVIFQASFEEKFKIANALRKIDFANGNVNHFLKFLAEAYIKTNY